MAAPITDRPIRWAIAGPGRIADKLATDFTHVPGAELVAVGSRSAERAAAFAAKHGIARPHGSYRELIDDPAVDVVYIATPHPQHHQLALAAIDAGKALLVEKSFTATVAGAEDIAARASAAGVFVMEAMWTRFLPAVVALRERLAGGEIGEVLSVQADLGVTPPFDPADRLFAKDLGGGALLDVGVYVVSFAQMVLGNPGSVAAAGQIGPTGVEIDAAVLLGYDNGSSATLLCSLHSPLPGYARVFGTTGWIAVLPRFHHPDQFVVHRQDAADETITAPHSGGGYCHQLIEVTEALRAGRTQSATMPLADTIAVQRIMEDALGQLGIEHREATDVI
jgi:predicted dehydrogenase